MPIIAVSGRAGSGKSTVGRIIQECLGDDVLQIAFADPVKQICMDVFDWGPAHVYGNLKGEPDLRYPRAAAEGVTYLTPREAMQTLGTDWGRTAYPGIWAAMGVRRALQWTTTPQRVAVITDCRFINEAELVRKEGGAVWFLGRDVGAAKGGLGSHPSETEMLSDDFQSLVSLHIENQPTLSDLADQVRGQLWAAGLLSPPDRSAQEQAWEERYRRGSSS